MKPDITITISASVIIAALIYGGGEVNNATFEGLPRILFHLIAWPLVASIIRCMVLWFQTLIDAARPKDQKSPRSGWMIAHFVFGPLASYPYYYLHRRSPPR